MIEKKTGRSYRCTLCRGRKRIISKYLLFLCGRCLRTHASDLGWQIGR